MMRWSVVEEAAKRTAWWWRREEKRGEENIRKKWDNDYETACVRTKQNKTARAT